MPKTNIINVLYVDDEAENLKSFEAGFRKDFNVFTAISAKKAEIILSKDNIHVLITDQRMPETTGTELLENSVKKYPNQSRILLTGYSDFEAIMDAVNKGQIFKYLEKPWDEDLLREYIKVGYDLFIRKIMLQQYISKLNQSEKAADKILKKKSNN